MSGIKRTSFGQPEGNPRKINARKGTGIQPDVREALKMLDQDALEALRQVMRGKSSPGAKVAAAIHVLDRNHGKVPIPVEAAVRDERDYHVTITVETPETPEVRPPVPIAFPLSEDAPA